jgi:prolipoprotein diacylglyceryl transferase
LYNDLFSIGPITVHGYGLMIGIGVVCALLVGDKRAKKYGLNGDVMYSLGIICVAAGMVGAKLLYCLLDIKSFIKNPLSMLTGSGFVVYGGIIVGVLAGILYCRIKKLVFIKYFDIAVVSIALAQGFGRIGCLLAGCCYGHETDSFIGIVFHNSYLAPNDVKLMPTQILSSLGNFAIAIVLIWYARKKPRDGAVAALYCILYSVGRFFIEFLRNDYRGSIGFMSTSQFISVFVLLFGAAFMYISQKRKQETEPEPAPVQTEE